MNDETRDPELQSLRGHWVTPAALDSLDDRVLAAYRRELRLRQLVRRVWIPVLAAAMLLVALRIANVRPVPARPAFVPVHQPQLIVLSRGERP